MITLRQLPPAHARLCLHIRDLCRHELHMEKCRKLCLAISGGADSTALAIIFHLIAPMLDCELLAVHVDHCLRPESGGDAQFSRELCQSLGIICHMEKIDVAAIAREQSRGLEEAGREARYGIFRCMLESGEADYILLGHHAGDLAEDMLLRLIRGVGWPALGGMKAREGGFLRPLLTVNPKQLRELLLAMHHSWREDASNQSLAFRRNRVRHEIMPLLERENPSILRSCLHLHQMAALDEKYWTDLLEKSLARFPWHMEEDEAEIRLVLPRKLLDSLAPAARLRLYRHAYKSLKIMSPSGTKGQIRADAFFQLERTLQSGLGGRTFQLPGSTSITIKAGNISFHLAKNGGRETALPASRRSSRP